MSEACKGGSIMSRCRSGLGRRGAHPLALARGAAVCGGVRGYAREEHGLLRVGVGAGRPARRLQHARGRRGHAPACGLLLLLCRRKGGGDGGGNAGGGRRGRLTGGAARDGGGSGSGSGSWRWAGGGHRGRRRRSGRRRRNGGRRRAGLRHKHHGRRGRASAERQRGPREGDWRAGSLGHGRRLLRGGGRAGPDDDWLGL